MSPYPNAYQIEEMFAARTQPAKFHEYMADPVDVEVVGEDHEVAGHYKAIEEFNDKIFARISDTVKRESIRLEIKRVIGGGESAVRLIFPCDSLRNLGKMLPTYFFLPGKIRLRCEQSRRSVSLLTISFSVGSCGIC